MFLNLFSFQIKCRHNVGPLMLTNKYMNNYFSNNILKDNSILDNLE